MKVGSQVVFAAKVFLPPYASYYKAYKGLTFQVVAYRNNYSCVELKCFTNPKVKVNGYIHLDEIKEA